MFLIIARTSVLMIIPMQACDPESTDAVTLGIQSYAAVTARSARVQSCRHACTFSFKHSMDPDRKDARALPSRPAKVRPDAAYRGVRRNLFPRLPEESRVRVGFDSNKKCERRHKTLCTSPLRSPLNLSNLRFYSSARLCTFPITVRTAPANIAFQTLFPLRTRPSTRNGGWAEPH